MEELQREFELSCEETIQKCRSLGYAPTVWIRMIQTHGAVETARRLVLSGDFQDGFLKLLSLGRPDLTVENAILDERWRDLFTDEERKVARWRLDNARR